MILGGWQRLVPDKILKTLKYGGLGQHGSSEFLPKFRGRSPLNWSIIMGKRRLIWNLFVMTSGIDDGDIVDFIEFLTSTNGMIARLSPQGGGRSKKDVPPHDSPAVCRKRKSD